MSWTIYEHLVVVMLWQLTQGTSWPWFADERERIVAALSVTPDTPESPETLASSSGNPKGPRG